MDGAITNSDKVFRPVNQEFLDQKFFTVSDYNSARSFSRSGDGKREYAMLT